MSLDARRIALQGVGYVALALATQGLLPLEQAVLQPRPPLLASGGGPGAQVSLSDWQRRYPVTTPAPAALVAQVDAAALAARRKRRRNHELLLLLG